MNLWARPNSSETGYKKSTRKSRCTFHVHVYILNANLDSSAGIRNTSNGSRRSIPSSGIFPSLSSNIMVMGLYGMPTGMLQRKLFSHFLRQSPQHHQLRYLQPAEPHHHHHHRDLLLSWISSRRRLIHLPLLQGLVQCFRS